MGVWIELLMLVRFEQQISRKPPQELPFLPLRFLAGVQKEWPIVLGKRIFIEYRIFVAKTGKADTYVFREENNLVSMSTHAILLSSRIAGLYHMAAVGTVA